MQNEEKPDRVDAASAAPPTRPVANRRVFVRTGHVKQGGAANPSCVVAYPGSYA
jgi:hypothetical protein